MPRFKNLPARRDDESDDAADAAAVTQPENQSSDDEVAQEEPAEDEDEDEDEDDEGEEDLAARRQRNMDRMRDLLATASIDSVSTLARSSSSTSSAPAAKQTRRRRAAGDDDDDDEYDAASERPAPRTLRSAARGRTAAKLGRTRASRSNDDEEFMELDEDGSAASRSEIRRKQMLAHDAKSDTFFFSLPYEIMKKEPSPAKRKFGPIPNVPVGSLFGFRKCAHEAGVHRGLVPGIAGHHEYGVWSITCNGGYDGDIDEGDRIIFSGSGGRALSEKNLRTAPQTMDMELSSRNAAFIKSYDLGRSIRVVRGPKSGYEHAPHGLYRYDGLYKCTDWTYEDGPTGFKVYRFTLEREPGQPPLESLPKTFADPQWAEIRAAVLAGRGLSEEEFQELSVQGVEAFRRQKAAKDAGETTTGTRRSTGGRRSRRSGPTDDDDDDSDDDAPAASSSSRSTGTRRSARISSRPASTTPIAADSDDEDELEQQEEEEEMVVVRPTTRRTQRRIATPPTAERPDEPPTPEFPDTPASDDDDEGEGETRTTRSSARLSKRKAKGAYKPGPLSMKRRRLGQ
ncbi:hypothetical protein H9P43_009844 [Blastocladiella emersonii ATCC 22665]|nr:hypothetical protein H9P43_009844 [Blastocladiella emersonii ATCC 22665]